MKNTAKQYSAEIHVDLSPEQVWDFLSDTDHLNRVLGSPPIQYGSLILSGKDFCRMASTRLFGIFRLEWKEYPFEWIRNKGYTVQRLFERGPLSSFNGGMETSPSNEGTRIRVYAEIAPRNILGRILTPLAGRKGMRDIIRYIQDYLRISHERGKEIRPPARRSQVTVQRLDERLTQLSNVNVDETLIQCLRRRLVERSDEEVIRMRPYELAAAWNTDSHETLRLFLHATRAGILNLIWEMMCPNCRVPKEEYNTLGMLTNQFHCDLCGVSYEADFERFVELRFSVHPAIREVRDVIYCLGSPARAPHILAQQYLEPGMEREFELPLDAEDYRIRTLASNHISSLVHTHTGQESIDLIYHDGVWSRPENPFKPGPVRFRLKNDSADVIVAVVERVRWDPLALTAAEVTTLQEFRNLFSSEVLAPGRHIGVQNIAIFFTDLKGSTSLYESIGEAPAFNRVHRHFEYLMEVVQQNHGAIIKTIGDAIMAAFSRPEQAVRAALEAQAGLDEFNRSLPQNPPLVLKIGIHHGPVIAVNANGRLDYFGRTVNIAARIEDQSQGNDVVLSDDYYNEPETRKIIGNFPVQSEQFSAKLKGIKEEFLLRRLKVR